MHFPTAYPTISLDTIANHATYLIGQSKPLRGNQAYRLLTLIFGRWFMPCPDNIFKRGNPFHARTQASHKALGASLGLQRRWICELTDRLEADGWIATHAPRLPNGQQAVTTYRPGWKFKKILVKLVKAKQPHRMHDQQQKLPTKEEREKNKGLFAGLIAEVGEKLAMNKAKRL